MKSIDRLQKTLQEKNLAKEKIDVILFGFIASALATAASNCNFSDDYYSTQNFESITKKIITLPQLSDLEEVFNEEIASSRELTKEEKKFVEQFGIALNKLIQDFLAKI